MRYASVCDGIGAAHVAWQPLGWECAWTSEIEPFPSAVVDERWKLKNVGDMTQLTEEQLHNEGPISLLVGGTPCQSFSVAGLRKGLEDPRGNLALRFTQLVGVLRPTWVVWENVPGVLSSGGGRDFGSFLGALAELGYGFAYRILDAQWFGVAQRRRRVFVVAHARDWRRAASVLFERESVFGNPPTRGAEREGTAATASNCSGFSGEPIWRGGDQANSEHCVGHAGTLNCDKGQQGGIVAGVIAFKANMSEPSCVNGLSETLQAKNQCAVAFTAKQCGCDFSQDVAPTMRAMCHAGSHANGGGQLAVAFTHSGYSNQPAWITGDRTDCLPSSGHSDGSHQGIGVVAFKPKFFNRDNAKMEGALRSDGSVGTLLTNDSGDNAPHVAMPAAVRRLTPRECERLQGFPDDYTLVTYRNKPAADGPRYKALGNSMAVPVMRWIGERIASVDSLNGAT